MSYVVREEGRGEEYEERRSMAQMATGQDAAFVMTRKVDNAP